MAEDVAKGRIRLLDAVRGFSVISMVGFHLCYDLAFLAGVGLPLFEPPFRDVWRASISWTFLLVAGIMCTQSRDNLRRAGRYLAVTLAIYLVTSLAGVDDAISFGIIFCMGGSTLVAWALLRAGLLRASWAGVALLVATFLLCLPVPQGSVGLPGHLAALPAALYATPWLSWLGFPGPHFVSGDYYPLLPFALLYLAGAVLGLCVERGGGWPSWAYRHGCRPLEFVGRHALWVYVLHQPVLLVLLGLV